MKITRDSMYRALRRVSLHIANVELVLAIIIVIVRMPEVFRNFRVPEKIGIILMEEPAQNKMQPRIDAPVSWWKSESVLVGLFS